ncbi:MAG: alpha/beta hydrolase, partial [Alphaproteobacteria bacterium]|nr:alpha/beta hydrolase [Alphaproteobacteria bacterium]
MPGIVGWIVGGYVGLLLLLFAAQRSLLYHPTKVVPEPSQFGVAEMEVVQVPTADSLKLHCWWRPPTREDKATVIYFHGNAGHIGDRAFKIRPLLNQGYG